MDRYWIGGTGSWSETSHWSNANGGSGGYSAPTSTDNVFFSSGSFTTDGSVITVDVDASCSNLSFSGINKTMSLISSSKQLNIYGSLDMSSSLTWTFTSTAYTYLRSTSSVTITTNGCVPSMNVLYFNGVGGKWTLQDDWNCGIINPMYFVNGEFDTGGYNITKTAVGDLSWQNQTGTKTLTLGDSIITLGNGVLFGTSNDAGLTVNAGTSTIKQTGDWFTGATKTFYNIELNRAIGAMGGYVGSFTCYNMYRISGNSTTANLPIGGNITVTNELVLSGTNSTIYRLLVSSNTIGTKRTITVPAIGVSASNVDFGDIIFANAIDLSSIPGGSGDCGGNSGITFTSGSNQYFKYTSGAVNWGDNNWVTSSGGTVSGRVPLPQDTAIFDNNSVTGTSVVSINISRIGSLNMEMLSSYQITLSRSIATTCYGNFILSNRVFVTGAYSFYFSGSGSLVFSPYYKLINYIYINAPYGIYNCLSNVFTTSDFNIQAGTFNFNGYNLLALSFVLAAGATSSLGDSSLTITNSGASGYGSISISSTSNFFANNSTIKLIPSTGTQSLAFGGGGKNFNTVWFTGTNTGGFNISGSNTFNEILIDAGKSVRFTGGTTQQIRKFSATGNPSSPIYISGITSSTHTLNYTGSYLVKSDYLNISYSNATPNNKWYAGGNSTNGGTNSGWIFQTISNYMSSGPSINTLSNDSNLISLINQISGNSYASISDALIWVNSQDDVLVVNKDYPNIVTDDLVMLIDPSFTPSYPKGGTYCYDLSGYDNNGYLIDGVSYNNGTFVFSNNYINVNNFDYGRYEITVEAFVKFNSSTTGYKVGVISKWQTGAGTNNEFILSSQDGTNCPGYASFTIMNNIGLSVTSNDTSLMVINKWYYLSGTFDGTYSRIYINGIIKGTSSVSGSRSIKTYSSQNISLAAFGSSYQYRTECSMSVSKMYKRALSTSEILQNYYQSDIITDGLVLFLDASNLTCYESGLTASDISNNSYGLSASLINGVEFSNIGGSSWLLNSNYSQYISVNYGKNINPSTNPFTISVWIKPSSIISNQMYISSGQSRGNGVSGARFYISIYNGYWDYGIQSSAWGSGNVSANIDWNNITIQMTGSIAYFYLNGESIYEKNYTSYALNDNFWIGNHDNNYYFNGNISDIKIYNRSLSSSEIFHNYEETKYRYGI